MDILTTAIIFLTTTVSLSQAQANCKDILDENSSSASGVHQVSGPGGTFSVPCNMTLLGGGWTIIQQRLNDSDSFNKNWTEYRNGFGDPNGNFWLGLQRIRDIVSQRGSTFELYIGMQSFHPTDTYRFALYKSFNVGSEEEKYTLNIGDVTEDSNARDSLLYHNGKQFSTPDQDNDSAPRTHCAQVFKAGWWFHNCHDALLNGQWYTNGLMDDLDKPDGIIWETWAGDRESLKATMMAVRPL